MINLQALINDHQFGAMGAVAGLGLAYAFLLKVPSIDGIYNAVRSLKSSGKDSLSRSN